MRSKALAIIAPQAAPRPWRLVARRLAPGAGTGAATRAIAGGPPRHYLIAMARFDDIRTDFEFLDDWEDRYKYLIDLGRALPSYPEEHRDDAHKVRGCASQVWFHAEPQNGALLLHGDSDAHIVKGLIALLFALYSGKRPAEMLKLDAAAALQPFELDDHLTPQRSNGLHSMVKRIRAMAGERAA